MEKVSSQFNSLIPAFDNDQIIYVRLCPQGIPSGRNHEDMLSEVRKEAYLMRFNKNEKSNYEKSFEDEDDEQEEISASSIAGPEAWSNWYPQERLAWVMYGVPSENPTEHWNIPISNGPTDAAPHYYTDANGVRSSKCPPRRTVQEEKVTMDSIVKKQRSTDLSMRAKRITLQDEKLEMIRSARDLTVIERLSKNADTDEKKVSYKS